MAATAVAPAYAAGTAQALPEELTVLTANICGASKGACEGTGTVQEKLQQVVRQVRLRPSTGIIMLQEACEKSHTKALSDALALAGLGNWAYHHMQARRITNGNYFDCDMNGSAPDDRPGPAVLMRKYAGNDITGVTVTFPDVPGDDWRTQGAACIWDYGSMLHACSAHFVDEAADVLDGDPDDTRAAAAARYAEHGYEQREENFATFIGGDLNLRYQNSTDYANLQPLYFYHEEVDPANRFTTGISKLDYIFYDPAWDLIISNTVDNGFSDHKMLYGTLILPED
ncbi:endonuclease/exonuclease/phosphatase family protein [Actinomycetes bacterium KLBMP 9797]